MSNLEELLKEAESIIYDLQSGFHAWICDGETPKCLPRCKRATEWLAAREHGGDR